MKEWKHERGKETPLTDIPMVETPPKGAVRSVGANGNPVASVVSWHSVTRMNLSNYSLEGPKSRFQRLRRNMDWVVSASEHNTFSD